MARGSSRKSNSWCRSESSTSYRDYSEPLYSDIQSQNCNIYIHTYICLKWVVCSRLSIFLYIFYIPLFVNVQYCLTGKFSNCMMNRRVLSNWSLCAVKSSFSFSSAALSACNILFVMLSLVYRAWRCWILVKFNFSLLVLFCCSLVLYIKV